MILPGFTNVTGDITIEVVFKEAEKEEEPIVPDTPIDDNNEESDVIVPITVDKIISYIIMFIVSLLILIGSIKMFKKSN